MRVPFTSWRDAGRRAARLLRHPFLAVPLLFNYWTSAPGIGSSDTALIVDEMQRLDLSTHVNHHNLTLIVGWLFSALPVGEPARAANLASVFLGTIAVSLFYSPLGPRRTWWATSSWPGSGVRPRRRFAWWRVASSCPRRWLRASGLSRP